MATKDEEYKDVKSNEFFYDNMSMLGFSNRAKALVMSAKEAVDNSLDSCEEMSVLPDIYLELSDYDDDTVKMIVEDNGQGIPEDHIQDIFGQILYGSKFGVLRQTRGQQGIGISSVFLWSQKFRGEPLVVTTKLKDEDTAKKMEITSRKKGDEIIVESKEEIDWDRSHGTRLEFIIPATWRSRKKLEKYLKGTSLANPSARITYKFNDEDPIVLDRSIDEPPELPDVMKPHPHSLDIGMLQQMLENNKVNARKFRTFLRKSFTKISSSKADKICEKADVDTSRSLDLSQEECRHVVEAIHDMDFRKPSNVALYPLGEDIIRKTLGTYNPEYIGTSRRDMFLVEGHPTIVETGIAYGGDIPKGDTVDYYRVANRVPLVYDKSSCALKKAIDDVSWSRYELEETGGDVPMGPAVIFVHVCSTQVPFGNEAKTFVAEKKEIIDETRKSLQACGRDFSRYVKKRKKRQEHIKKTDQLSGIFEDMSDRLGEMTNKEQPDFIDSLANACNTVVVDKDNGVVRNPTDKNITVEIDGEDVKIEAGSSVEIDSTSDVDYTYSMVEV